MAWMVIFCYGAESWAPAEGERGARGALRARGALLEATGGTIHEVNFDD